MEAESGASVNVLVCCREYESLTNEHQTEHAHKAQVSDPNDLALGFLCPLGFRIPEVVALIDVHYVNNLHRHLAPRYSPRNSHEEEQHRRDSLVHGR